MQSKDTKRVNYKQLTFDDFMKEPERFRNRKDLLNSMSLYGTAIYLAACIAEMDKGKLTNADYWYEFLKVKIDNNEEEV